MKTECPHCQHEIEIELSIANQAPVADVIADAVPDRVRIRPGLRLSEVERQIKASGFLSKPPARQTLINMIQRGEFEGRLMSIGWIVYEDSLHRWLRKFEDVPVAA